MHPKGEIERVYRVRLDRGIADEDFSKLKRGVRLEDGVAKPYQAGVIPRTKRTEVYIALTEGRNREVRRMVEALGYEVEALERVSFAGLTTQGLARGTWRALTRAEVRHLKEQAGLES